jgi:hypothetical protein
MLSDVIKSKASPSQEVALPIYFQRIGRRHSVKNSNFSQGMAAAHSPEKKRPSGA